MISLRDAMTIDIWREPQRRPKFRRLTKITHNDAIVKIVNGNHGAFAKSFHKDAWSQLRLSVKPEVLEDAELTYSLFKKMMPLIPDAYSINPWDRKITLFEVEVTSRLTARKLYIIAHFGIELALMAWSLTLIRVDEFGRMRKESWEQFV